MWAEVKLVPERTSRSMFGVWIAVLPSDRIVSNRWSSVRKKSTLGRLLAMGSHQSAGERGRRQAAVAGRPDNPLGDGFRISIAGAQEKTALLRLRGKWCMPVGATPTTHIIKLPLGTIGGSRGDFSDSVENEWFCTRTLRELGLPVSEAEVCALGGKVVLVVRRFDRQWMGEGADPTAMGSRRAGAEGWIARLPQEDLCQATGKPPSAKYEVDGGPTIGQAMDLLSGSEDAQRDKGTSALAKLAFWLLAATDGHGKNFSLHQLAGGRYRMTPLYDILSAWPLIGPGARQLHYRRAKLAMWLSGRNRHYGLAEIQTRHWLGLAVGIGVPGLWDRMQALVRTTDGAIQRVLDFLPGRFPERVATTIREGVRSQTMRFQGG
jgi:serine/threonine-protein kinase HipA